MGARVGRMPSGSEGPRYLADIQTKCQRDRSSDRQIRSSPEHISAAGAIWSPHAVV